MEELIKKYLFEKAMDSVVPGYSFANFELTKINFSFKKDDKTFVCFEYVQYSRKFTTPFDEPGIYKLKQQLVIDSAGTIIENEEFVKNFIKDNKEAQKLC